MRIMPLYNKDSEKISLNSDKILILKFKAMARSIAIYNNSYILTNQRVHNSIIMIIGEDWKKNSIIESSDLWGVANTKGVSLIKQWQSQYFCKGKILIILMEHRKLVVIDIWSISAPLDFLYLIWLSRY